MTDPLAMIRELRAQAEADGWNDTELSRFDAVHSQVEALVEAAHDLPIILLDGDAFYETEVAAFRQARDQFPRKGQT
jgi:hypothetical protein